MAGARIEEARLAYLQITQEERLEPQIVALVECRSIIRGIADAPAAGQSSRLRAGSLRAANGATRAHGTLPLIRPLASKAWPLSRL